MNLVYMRDMWSINYLDTGLKLGKNNFCFIRPLKNFVLAKIFFQFSWATLDWRLKRHRWSLHGLLQFSPPNVSDVVLKITCLNALSNFFPQQLTCVCVYHFTIPLREGSCSYKLSALKTDWLAFKGIVATKCKSEAWRRWCWWQHSGAASL